MHNVREPSNEFKENILLLAHFEGSYLLNLNEIKKSDFVVFAKIHNPFIKCNQIHSVCKTDGEEAIERFLTFDLIAVNLIKIGHNRKSMVIGHDLKNSYTKC